MFFFSFLELKLRKLHLKDLLKKNVYSKILILKCCFIRSDKVTVGTLIYDARLWFVNNKGNNITKSLILVIHQISLAFIYLLRYYT